MSDPTHGSAAPETYAPPPPGDPPRDVADLPPPPGIIATDPRSEGGQWALIWREFRKRPLAVAASCLLGLLVTACVFAPFLASERPIFYFGANRFAYADSYRTVRVLLPRIASADDAERRVLADLAADRLEEMASAVVPETANEVRAFRDRLMDSAVNELAEDDLSQLRRDLAAFASDEVGFVATWHAPVLNILHPLAVVFLIANTVGIMLLAAKLIVRRRWRKFWRRGAALSLLVLPFLGGFLWWLLVPETNDRTPYKRGVRAELAQEEPDAPVFYESVLWPPIPYSYDEIDQDRKFARPEVLELQTDERRSPWDQPHWLGTDKIGRDILSRMLWGGRISLSVGLVAVGIYVAIGVVIGSIAGFFRGWVDMLISRVIEIVIVFPTFFLILTIVAFVGPSLMNIMVIIGLTGWTGVARLVRGEFLRLADQEFVIAGRALGYSAPRLIFRHVLPNAFAPVLVAATFGVAGAILTESSLSFLGLGITIPTPSWGGILAEGRATTVAPWLIYLPGCAIFITILCYNLTGEALRDASDPRLRGSR